MPNNFYDSADIAKKFGVSNPTVGYWIKGAIQGKNNLEITEIEGKKYILVNENNNAELVRLSNEGKKHIPENSNKIKIVYANKTFYNKFSLSEQLEIYADLKYTKRLNTKFEYKSDKVVDYWDKQIRNGVSPITNFQLFSMQGILNAVEDLMRDNKKINIFDLGVGNGQPIKIAIEFLLAKKN